MNPETQSDRHVLNDPKNLKSYEYYRTIFEKVCYNPLKNDKNWETSISSKNIILKSIELNINQKNQIKIYDRPPNRTFGKEKILDQKLDKTFSKALILEQKSNKTRLGCF